MIDLSELPAPDVVEMLDYESAYQSRVASFRALYPQFDALLESDPVIKLLELAVYLEVQLRARVNDASRASMIQFAADTSLDHLGAFYGLPRMAQESDSRFRTRIQLRIAALAGNGTAQAYRVLALSASVDVVDAAVITTPADGVVIAVWANADTDSHAALVAVQTALQADNARPLGVKVSAILARAKPVDVVATIYREPSAPLDLAAQITAALPGQIENHADLGRDFSRSWLLARLHVSGVSRVELAAPAQDLTIAADEYAAAGELAIVDGGVAW